MIILALALSLSGAALNASTAGDYRLAEDPEARMFADPRRDAINKRRAWTPGVDGWTRERSYCPSLFQRDLGNGSIFRFGFRCKDNELPYANPVD